MVFIRDQRPVNMIVVKVDVITAIYNAEATIQDAVRSAMHQEIPTDLVTKLVSWANNTQRQRRIHLDICVCCYDDASTDGSLDILSSLEKETRWEGSSSSSSSSSDKIHDIDCETIMTMQTRLLIGSAPIGTSSRGAGYARNRAAKLRENIDKEDATNDKNGTAATILEGKGQGCRVAQYHFLCILDSDDIMHSTRIAEQTCTMLSLDADERKKTLLGCQFDRIPKDSTHHYSQWANSLSDERLYLEKFRECTLVRE